MRTPSISGALSGKTGDGETEVKPLAQKQFKEEEVVTNTPFSEKELLEVWPAIAEKYSDQLHLYNTLVNKPVLRENYVVQINVENSVQQDKLRLLKPEIMGYLRRLLKNSLIDVRIQLLKSSNEKKILTDEQKMKAMIQRNPALALLKNRFNLDFNG